MTLLAAIQPVKPLLNTAPLCMAALFPGIKKGAAFLQRLLF
jgi:hypothetical protein